VDVVVDVDVAVVGAVDVDVAVPAGGHATADGFAVSASEITQPVVATVSTTAPVTAPAHRVLALRRPAGAAHRPPRRVEPADTLRTTSSSTPGIPEPAPGRVE
jgi:hypothetical protein